MNFDTLVEAAAESNIATLEAFEADRAFCLFAFPQNLSSPFTFPQEFIIQLNGGKNA